MVKPQGPVHPSQQQKEQQQQQQNEQQDQEGYSTDTEDLSTTSSTCTAGSGTLSSSGSSENSSPLHGIHQLPIRKESASRLKQRGINRPSDMVKIMLDCGSRESFVKWLQQECNIETKEAEACYKALQQNAPKTSG